ncbi:hypothetical protein QVD99_002321 [Batrachochytrium dendrobatidis]|nr:hypothetical protein O5D80_004947 [Batrachochytrium dendrobatidis]KAK5671292.1 hypothetical protein QVD99_002321 [Batrachochytrium dendrobatidis]
MSFLYMHRCCFKNTLSFSLTHSFELSSNTITPVITRNVLGAVRTKTDYANAPKPTIQKSPLVSPLESLQVIPKDLLPYDIKRRKESGWLPVYSAYRNGRSRKLTLIRDVRGNTEQLKQDLSHLIPKERISIKSAGSKLEINGDYIEVVRDWLCARKF